MRHRGLKSAVIPLAELAREPRLLLELRCYAFVTEQIGTHHRGDSEGHDGRGYERHHKRDAQRYEHAPLDALEEKQRQEAGDDDER